MAHENLKFRIDLNDNKEWQPILAAQELQTFYVIYIKFKEVVEDKELELGNTAKYTYQLRIQNFRGAISFGFSGTPVMELVEDDKEFCLKLDIPLKAFHVHELTEEICQLFPNKIERKKLLEVSTSLKLLEGMYNKKNPINSRYMFPYRVERDGNTAIEVGRRPLDGSDGKFEVYNDKDLAGRPFGICNPNLSIVF